jgi:hypothetical protein
MNSIICQLFINIINMTKIMFLTVSPLWRLYLVINFSIVNKCHSLVD